MNELRDDDFRAIVTAAAATVLDDPDQHVARYWQGLKTTAAEPTTGDQAESGGLGLDILPEIVSMVQYAWSYAQNHGANVADGVAANALYAALIGALLKWCWPSGKSGLSEEERQAVADAIAKHLIAVLEKTGHSPPRRTASDEATEQKS